MMLLYQGEATDLNDICTQDACTFNLQLKALRQLFRERPRLALPVLGGTAESDKSAAIRGKQRSRKECSPSHLGQEDTHHSEEQEASLAFRDAQRGEFQWDDSLVQGKGENLQRQRRLIQTGR